MRAEEWETKDLELDGWPGKLSSYRIGASHIAIVELLCSGSILATAIAATREKAHEEVLQSATTRLRCTRLLDAHLTVGG